MRLKDQVALVTGGSRGIGKAIAMSLAHEGARVFVNYLNSKVQALEVVAEINSNNGSAHPIHGDVTDKQQVCSMMEEVYSAYGRIDILVNNAGINRDAILPMMKDEEWLQVINTNLGGTFNCSREVTKFMVPQKYGRIINMSSVVAEKGGRGCTNYASSKGAINSFTRALALELAPKGITVNAVAPGLIVTDMSQKVRRLYEKELLPEIPMKRPGNPKDVAGVVVFLASDEAKYTTGQVIKVDGGMTL